MFRAIFVFILLQSLIGSALAEEKAQKSNLSVYFRTGYMDWVEKADGKQFVRETGATQEAGVIYPFSCAQIAFSPSIGVWNALLYYDGSKAETEEPYKTFSGDIGIKANLNVSVPIKVADNMILAPMTELDAITFVRAAPGELWMVLAARTGLIATFRGIDLKGGVLFPFFTSDTVDWKSVGVKSLITVQPKGMITPFAEVNYKLSERWTAGAYFEMWRWAASDGEPYQYVGNNPNSVLAKGGSLYQPDTIVVSTGLSMFYQF